MQDRQNLLKEKHYNALEDELKSCKKENVKLREDMSRLKKEHEEEVVQLRDRVTSLERDEIKAGALVELYRSRFENLILRVKRLEDDAKVLLMPNRVQHRDQEEAWEQNGATRGGQPTKEIACSFKTQKNDNLSTFNTVIVMPVKPQIEATKAEAASKIIDTNNKKVPPGNERNSARVVIEIIDSDDEQPMGVDDDGETKLPRNSSFKLKELCDSGFPTAPASSPSNNIETSGTSTKHISWVLKSCGENMRSEQTSDHLQSQIINACKISFSGDWKNEEDMVMALEKDPDLCIRAICCLHQEESFNGFDLLNTRHGDMITVLEKDPEFYMKAICALRGTALAESFIHGNPHAKLEKDEKAIRDCKRIAEVYSKKLFAIYKKDKEELLSYPENRI